MNASRTPNRLARETSPYLLQHADNPVDWYPWGAEALEKARREDLPVLLSIGYAACHWCHVMERESFEDNDIAALMNEAFVCIKVDREERPDLDDVYMTAVQMMTGQGGWPLTVFLTPELQPFFGGTYFPPGDRPGMPGFPRVLRAVKQSFEQQREAIESASKDLVEHIHAHARRSAGSVPPEAPGENLLNAAVEQYRRRFEPVFGGFSHAPKFPHPMAISLLLRYAHSHHDDGVLHMATLSLDRMAYGGVYDQLGGGFHRYATDDRWLVPHFEKMLYDNALLAITYLEAVQLTGNQEYARVAAETLDWVIREMQAPAGGYYSTLDADSEGKEGKFYVWRYQEVEETLGRDADAFCAVYGVTPEGNWEGDNILNLARPVADSSAELGQPAAELSSRLAAARSTLLQARERRIRPGLDDKILTDWNGLMIAAMVKGYRVLGEARFLESARRAATFMIEAMIVDDRLLHSHRCGRSHLLAYIDDHANLLWGLIELFEGTFEWHWLDAAEKIASRMIELFQDDASGGFFFTGADHERLIARMKPGSDGATPSGNAVAASALLRLHELTGNDAYDHHARQTLGAFHAQMEAAPSSFAHMIAALDYQLRSPREIVMAGATQSPEISRTLRALWRQYRPHDLIIAFDPSDEETRRRAREIAVLAGKEIVDGRPTFYLCERYTCRAPTHDLEAIIAS